MSKPPVSQSIVLRSVRRTVPPVATLVAVSVLALVALTGCAPASTTGAPPSPTASPSAKPVARLTTTGGVTCDDLASLTVVQSALGSTAVVAIPDSTNLYQMNPDLLLLATPLAGGIDCLWQSPTLDYAASIEVLPNATDALSAAQTQLASTDDSASQPGIPKYGQQSWTHCDPTTDQNICQFDVAVGGYWVEIVVTNAVQRLDYPESSGEQAFINQVVEAVGALPKAPVTWHPPVESYTAPASCDAVISDAVAQNDLGTSLTAVPPSEFVVSPLELAARSAAGTTACWWSDSSGATTVEYVFMPGADAVWSSAGPTDISSAGFTTLTGVGSAGWQQCQVPGGANECTAFVLDGHSWIELDYGSGVPLGSAAFDTFVKDVVASLH
ncbi:MAG TPA: hypothetical protein VHU90_00645 [Galbitalea sp.]|nr:hypothetical protein [Galbitalea sp.]